MAYSNIQTIRYMGNKSKLLDYIIPEIEKITKPGECICDIMAGTNSIGYALKGRNVIISNDIQYYSYIIAKCLLQNTVIPTTNEIHEEIDSFFHENMKHKHYNFFEKEYSDTYFSSKQCEEIDSLRYAIAKCGKNFDFYMTLLMSVMCKVQSTTGHFAQYMDMNHKRIKPLRELSVYDLFYDKVSDFTEFKTSNYSSYQFNLDYNDLFKNPLMDSVNCFYLDSPYTTDQYSRFYHILETVCKYDNPSLSHKAKYRDDRVQSAFCYKKTVANEFEKIIKYVSQRKAKLVISYSNHGVISIEELVAIAKEYYSNVELKEVDFAHSSQGKGTIKIKEIVLVLK